MVIDVLVYGSGLLILLAATLTDIKTREVPDFITYGAIFYALGLRAIISLILLDTTYILQGIAGFGLFFILAIIMFYSGQWGGADSKMLMAIGALLGLNFSFNQPLLGFLVNTSLFGALYGLLYSVVLAIQNPKKIRKELKKQYTQRKRLQYTLLVLFILVIPALLTPHPLTVLVAAIPFAALIIFYLFILVRSVETTCMIKQMKPTELTEGDWVNETIKHRGKIIAQPKDLGLNKKQITTLQKLYQQKKIKTIPVRQGIPFMPAFLIGLIITFFYGNWLTRII